MVRVHRINGRSDGATIRLRAILLALLAVALWPVMARADGIGGYLEYLYSKVNAEARDASGETTETRSTLFAQRYRLTLDKRVFPTVTLSGGGTFERTNFTSQSDGLESDATATKMAPFVELTLSTPLLTAGGGYRRDESWSNAGGISSPRQIREQTFARIGYRPDGLPPLDLQAGRNENYDTERTMRNNSEDYLKVSSRYSPIKDLRVSYSGAFSKFTDHLLNNESRTEQNSGTVDYSHRFWNNRVGFSGMYNVLHTASEFTTGGQGEIAIPRSPFSGLAALSDTPLQITLLSNTSLIDGNTAVAGGIDIGVPLPLGDARPRNIGLDFVVNTDLNTLYIWVDKPLPPNVANAYSWEIYTSDNNRDWILRQTVSPAPFAPFDNRFEVRFQNVVSRFVKIVTKPLASLPPPTVEYPDPNVFRNIQVTELQAFINRPAAEVAGKDSRASQSLNLDVRVKILEVPSLYYQLNYFLAKSSEFPSRYTVSNALSANHQFNRVLSGSARVGVDYSEDSSGRIVTYLYNAALAAVPLPTFTQTFSYSGRTEDAKGIRSDFHSIYLSNSAALYKGINVNLDGGANLANLNNGVRTQGGSLGAGMSLVPHRNVNMNASYIRSASERTGGGKPDATTSNSSGTISVSFTPLRTLYLYGNWGFTSQTGQPRSETTNFGASWSPFPGGNLHFSFPYTETHRTSDNSTERGFSPTVRWNINRRASLNVFYSWVRSDSISQESRTDVFSTNFRVGF